MKTNNLLTTALAAMMLIGCAATGGNNASSNSAPPANSAPAANTSAPADNTAPKVDPGPAEAYATKDKPGTVKIVASPEMPRVAMKTAKGNFLIELYEDNTPNTVANFMYLVEKGQYDAAEFWRKDPGTLTNTMHLIQGGGKTGGAKDLCNWSIRSEAQATTYGGLTNIAGTLAMARTKEVHSASFQFFINIKEHPHLDNAAQPYCVFGKVVEGMDVVEAIQAKDAIIDSWVVQKRDHKYVPVVKLAGKNNYGPLE